MFIDTADTFYNDKSNLSRRLINVLAHEHGHGVGLKHSCPVDQTKLMEPFASTAFLHAQPDDKLGGWRANGDDKEDNETSGTASNLGSLGNGATNVTDLSIDHLSDVDFYKFTVPANKKAAVTLTPIGTTYLSGPQNVPANFAGCSAGTFFNALTVQDLGVELRNTDGTSILASATAGGFGAAENIAATTLPTAGTYFVRAFASSAVNNVQGYQLSITISNADPVTPPTVTTTAATSVTQSSATLNGTVNPNGSSTSAVFQYGLTVTYTNSVPVTPTPGSGSSPVSVSAAISGLTCGGVTYNARLSATNGGGTTNGNNITFQTAPCPPTVTTTAATLLTQTTATLNGTINPNGTATNRRFQFGLTTSYGTTTPDLAIGSGSSPISVSFGATGLTCNTLYNFRAVGQNASGTTNGGNLTFTTSPCPPTATANAALNVSTTTADLSGSITSDGGGAITERGFVFSNAGVNANPLIGGGGVTKVTVAGTTGPLPLTNLAALSQSTTYAFKTFATNSSGTGYSPVRNFTTSDPASPLALAARTLSINSAAKSTLSVGTSQIWYRVTLFANRSYQVSAWPVDHEQGVDAAKLSVAMFSDNAGIVQANGVTGVSTVLEAAPNEAGDDKPFTATILPSVSGTYKIRVKVASGGSSAASVNLLLRETTLFSPWTSRAAGFEGFVEMHNNTNAPVNVTLRAFNNAGALQGTGITITLPPNATDFRTATQIGVPVNIFAGIVLTHDGAHGAVAANITTLNGANGLSFDSPFTSRSNSLLGNPVR